VFYELAVAHSAGIPVILLSEQGIDLPFDLKDERVFQYDLSPRAIHRGDNVRGLLAMIESVRRLQGKREVPFGNNLIPLNATSAALPYSVTQETNATAEFWLKLVSGARHRLYLAGIGFTGWRGIPGMREALGSAGSAGCDIRVLTMDAQNPAFQYMLNPEVTSTDPVTQGPRLAEARSWFKSAVAGIPTAEVRAMRSGMLFQQLMIFDNRALISPYMFTANTGYSPRLEVSENFSVFGAYLREFEQLWKGNPN